MSPRPTANEKDQRTWWTARFPGEIRELYERVLELFSRITNSRVEAFEAMLLAAEEWIMGQERARRSTEGNYEFTEWSNAIKDRDKWKCRFPQMHACCGRLVAHHIKLVSHCSKVERTSMDNGITVCVTAHEIIHTGPVSPVQWADRLRGAQGE